MTSAKTYRKIRKNGQQGEVYARRWLRGQMLAPHIEVLNDLIDLYVNNTYVEIKSCSESVVGDHPDQRRPGRFTIEKAQHDVLVNTNGCYLFVVLRQNNPPHLFLVRAEDVEWRRQIAWTVVIKYQKRFTTKEILFDARDPNPPPVVKEPDVVVI